MTPEPGVCCARTWPYKSYFENALEAIIIKQEGGGLYYVEFLAEMYQYTAH